MPLQLYNKDSLASADVLPSCGGAGATGQGAWRRWRGLHQRSQARSACAPGTLMLPSLSLHCWCDMPEDATSCSTMLCTPAVQA